MPRVDGFGGDTRVVGRVEVSHRDHGGRRESGWALHHGPVIAHDRNEDLRCASVDSRGERDGRLWMGGRLIEPSWTSRPTQKLTIAGGQPFHRVHVRALRAAGIEAT